MNKHVGSSCAQAAAKSGCRDALYDCNSVNSSTRKSSINDKEKFCASMVASAIPSTP